MADSKLLDLPAATSTDGTEQYYVVQGGVDKRAVGTLVGKRILTANTAFYVSTTGNDSTGTGAIGAPWATLQHAVDYIYRNIDGGGFRSVITLVAGTTGSPTVYGPVVLGPRTTGGIDIETSDGDPTHTTLSNTGFFGVAVLCTGPLDLAFGGMKLETNTGIAVRAFTQSSLTIGTANCPTLNIGNSSIGIFALAGASELVDRSNTTLVTLGPNYNSLVSADHRSRAFLASDGGSTYTFTGTPAWNTAFVQVQNNSYAFIGNSLATSLTGPSTGKRYEVSNGGILYSGFTSTNLPGNAAGTINNAYGINIGAGGYSTLGEIFWDSWATLMFDKGTVSSGTVTFNATLWSKYKLTVGGALTIAFSNWWPGSQSYSEVQIQLVNGGAFAITWPSTINWMKGDGTSSTTFSSMGVTLQASGSNFVTVWSPDGGTTFYGTAM